MTKSASLLPHMCQKYMTTVCDFKLLFDTWFVITCTPTYRYGRNEMLNKFPHTFKTLNRHCSGPVRYSRLSFEVQCRAVSRDLR